MRFPVQEPLAGGWTVGAIGNARSGLPVPVLVGRSDIVYVDGAGIVWANAAAGRTAVINTPGGGASRSTRRPDVVPGVDPFIKDGGLLFLNPAAFATPRPGEFGNLERNSIHGPGVKQIDMVVVKRIGLGNGPNIELRAEIFNLFNTDIFANPVGTLPNAIPTGAAGTTPAANTRAAGAAVHDGRGGHIRPVDLDCRDHRRARHQPPGPVRVPSEFLSVGCHRSGQVGPCTARLSPDLRTVSP